MPCGPAGALLGLPRRGRAGRCNRRLGMPAAGCQPATRAAPARRQGVPVAGLHATAAQRPGPGFIRAWAWPACWWGLAAQAGASCPRCCHGAHAMPRLRGDAAIQPHPATPGPACCSQAIQPSATAASAPAGSHAQQAAAGAVRPGCAVSGGRSCCGEPSLLLLLPTTCPLPSLTASSSFTSREGRQRLRSSGALFMAAVQGMTCGPATDFCTPTALGLAAWP